MNNISELETARELVTSFWRVRCKGLEGTMENMLELYRVQSATPVELVDDYKALIKILQRAVEIVDGRDNSENKDQGLSER